MIRTTAAHFGRAAQLVITPVLFFFCLEIHKAHRLVFMLRYVEFEPRWWSAYRLKVVVLHVLSTGLFQRQEVV